jgi:AAA family ATP:ADP antiporter
MSEQASRGMVVACALLAATVIAGQVVGKALRDALFLSHYSAEQLPPMMICAAILALAAAMVMARALSVWSPLRVVPIALMLHASLFAAEWGMVASRPGLAATVLYLHIGALAASVISAFWSMVGESFDPHSAKRAMARIGTAASLGGLVGGLAAWQLAGRMSLPSMLLGLALVYLVAALGTALLLTHSAPESDFPSHAGRGSTSWGLELVRTTPYLRLLAGLVVLAAFGEAGIDYLFKATAATRYGDIDELVSFFAVFNTGVGVVTLLLQAGVSRRLLERVGLAGAVAGLPGIVFVGGLAALASPGFASIVFLRGGAQSVESSIFRSGYELLYNPLPVAKKRPTKAVIDVACDKLGVAMGAGITLLIVATTPYAHSILLVISISSAIAALFIVKALHRGYVAELAAGLRTGLIDVHTVELVDATTKKTIADTLSFDRRELVAQIEAMRRPEGQPPDDEELSVGQAEYAARSEPNVPNTSGTWSAASNDFPTQNEITVEDAISMLARDDQAGRAVEALQRSGEHALGPLLAALEAPAADPRIRRRIPRVLLAWPTQGVVGGLLGVLGDSSFEVRYRAAGALMQITADREDLQINREIVLAAIRDAASVARVDSAAPARDDEVHSPFEREAAFRTLGRRYTLVFTLLSLLGDREPLHLAFIALGSDRVRLRGTAREYIDSVLPAEVRSALAPLLDDRSTASRASRPRRQVLEDLLATRDTLLLDGEAIRRLRGE